MGTATYFLPCRTGPRLRACRQNPPFGPRRDCQTRSQKPTIKYREGAFHDNEMQLARTRMGSIEAAHPGEVRTALQNAASIAGLLITTEALVTEAKGGRRGGLTSAATTREGKTIGAARKNRPVFLSIRSTRILTLPFSSSAIPTHQAKRARVSRARESASAESREFDRRGSPSPQSAPDRLCHRRCPGPILSRKE